MSRSTGIDPEREKRMGARCLALIALTGLTGFVTYFWPSKSALW
jgi:hypothetical protein